MQSHRGGGNWRGHKGHHQPQQHSQGWAPRQGGNQYGGGQQNDPRGGNWQQSSDYTQNWNLGSNIGNQQRQQFDRPRRYEQTAGTDVLSRIRPRVQRSSGDDGAVSKEQLEQTLANIARTDLAAGHHVSAATLMARAAYQLGYNSFDELGFDTEKVPMLDRLLRLENRVATMIGCFAAQRSVATLRDLEDEIVIFEKVHSFEDLQLGPLVRHPMVQRYFSPDSHTYETPDYSLLDFASDFLALSNQQKTRERMDPKEILAEVAALRGITDPRQLGVRINKLGFVMSVCSQVRQGETTLLPRLRAQRAREIEAQLVEEEKVKVLSLAIKPAPDRPGHAALQKLFAQLEVKKSGRAFKPFKHSKLLDSLEDHEIIELATAWLGVVHENRKRTDEEAIYSLAAKHYTKYSHFLERCDEIELTKEPWNKRYAYLKRVYDDAVKSLPAGPKGKKRLQKLLQNHVTSSMALFATCYANSGMCPERAEQNQTETDLTAAIMRQVQDYLPDGSSLREGEATNYGSSKGVWEILLSFLDVVEQRTLRRFQESIFSEINNRKHTFLRWIRGQETIISAIEERAQSVGVRVVSVQKNEKSESRTGTEEQTKNASPGEGNETEETVTVDLDTLVDVVKETLEKEMESAGESLGLFGCLERVERAVCERFGVADFKRLGHGSILHLVCTHPTLSEISAEIGDIRMDSGRIDLKEIASILVRTFGMEMVVAAGGINSMQGISGDTRVGGVEGDAANLSAMGRVLCSHFGVGDAKNLGYGTVRRLVRRVAAYVNEHNVNTSDTLCYAATLTLRKDENQTSIDGENGVGEEGIVGILGEVSVDMAMIAIGRAPDLVDLATCTQWDTVYAPSLGKLSSFILANTNALGSHGVQLLATGPQSFIKVQSGATTDTYLHALKQGHVTASAAHLCGVVVGAGHVTQAPLSLIGLHTHTAAVVLASPVNPDGSIDATMNVDAGKQRACQVIFNVMRALPQCLQSALAIPVLIGPLRRAIPEAHRIILSLVAQDPLGLALVHRLGLSHHIDTWASHYHETCLGAPSPISANKIPTRPETAADLGQQQQTANSQAPTTHGAGREQEGTEVGDPTDTVSVAPADAAQERMDESTAHALIETIRRDRFGRGVDLSEPLGAIVGQQNAMIARALGRLSRDLYSKDSHFVLELVQNADDNTYLRQTDAMANPPTVSFAVQSDRVVVRNNERGFTARDMQALCDVGNSTKSGQTAGYIGQKGIGFKSVFRVSNRPEIHSGGFHVKFDRDSDEMGYVLPTWIGPRPDADSHPQWSTMIILPLSSEMVRRRGELVQQFGDLHPSVLLFLHRLQRIVVADAVAGTVCTMTRHTLPSGYVQVDMQQTTPPRATTSTWMLVRRTHPVRDGLRDGVSITEVALAFPSLGDEIAPSSLGNRPPQQPVFAFLPLRSYGLRFVVQGDFILPSSREDVDVDSPWNQWLRGLIAPLFLEVMQKMKAEGTRRAEEAKRKAAERPKRETVVLEHERDESDESDESDEREGEEEEEKKEVKRKSGKRQRKRKGKQGKEVEKAKKRRKDEKGGKEEKGDDGEEAMEVTEVGEVDGMAEEEMEWDDGMTATYMLQFVPLEGEVTGFFRPLVSEILHGLRGLECVPTANGGWAVPSQVVFLEDHQAHRLIDASDIHRYLGLFTLHPSCHIGPALRSVLGIETFGPGHLMKIVHMRLDSTQSTTHMDPKWVANWLCALYRSLDRLAPAERSNIISGLKHLPLIPLASGGWTSVADGPVFLPVSSRGSEFGFEASLRVVGREMFSGQERVGESMVVDMLVAVGVNRPTPDRIIAHHIVPTMARLDPDAVCGFDPKLAAVYALYLRSNHGWDPHQVRGALVVSTSSGCMRLAGHTIFFPPPMGNGVGIPQTLPGHMTGLWPVLANAYLQADGNVAGWRQFFHLFGVQDFPVPEQTRRVFRAPLPSPWAEVPELVNLPKDTQVTILDSHCPSLHALLKASSATNPKTVLRCMELVVAALQDGWDRTYSPALTAHVGVSEPTGERILTIPSTFARTLKETSWVPSSDGKLRMGCELYGPNTRPYFGEGEVPTPSVKLSKGLAGAVGLVEEVSVGMMTSALVKWAREGTDGYVSSVQRMVALYKLLAQPPPEAVQTLAKDQVIWLPITSCSDPSTPISGHFHSTTDVCLKDPSALLHARGLMREASRTYRHYPTSHLRDSDVQVVLEFFESLGVAATPPTERYLSALETICQGPVTAEARKHVFSILATWATPLAEGHMTSDDVARLAAEMKRRNTPFLPTKASTWVSLAIPDAYLADDQTVGMRFERVPGVSLVDLPPPEKGSATRLRALCLALGLPLLSKSVRFSGFPTAARFATSWTIPLKNAIAVVQRYIYARHPTRYQSLVESGQAANLAHMTFAESPGVELAWTLGNHRVNQSNVACVVDDTTLYINTNHTKGPVLYDAIGRELSRVFSAGEVWEDVAAFVAYFLTANMGRTEAYKWLAARNIPELPESEMPWVDGAFAEQIADDPIVIEDDSTAPPILNVPGTQPLMPTPHPASFWPTPQSDHQNQPPVQVENQRGEERSWQPQVTAEQTQESAGVQDVFLQPVTVRATDIRLPGRPTSETAHAIGRWGEECVFGLLVKQEAGKGKVVWVNQEKESGLPYDILVTVGGATTYVEVKSTSSWDRVTFNLSEREFRMAEKNGQRYAVALVHGAGNSGARVRVFRDPAQRWRNGDLEMLMYVPSVAK